MLPLFDAHSHLPPPAAHPAGQTRVVCGTGEADWPAVLAHAASEPQVIPMLGLHPWQLAAARPAWSEVLENHLRAHRVGIGECGLDFSRKAADREGQLAALRLHLQLARTYGRPVALHLVQAWGALLELLAEVGVPPAGLLIHGFSGSAETARQLQAMGVFLSFSGQLLDPERTRCREAWIAAEADHLLLETDGTADLEALLAGAAALRGCPPEDLAAQTWENGQRCFRELLA